MKYKIVYIAFVGGDFGGVEQKIIAQYDALRKLGLEIHLFLVSTFIPSKILAFEIEKRSGINSLINTPSKIKNPLARRKEKFKLITSTLLQFNPKQTIVYFRYPLSDLLFMRFLKKNSVFTFITEHQDIELVSLKGGSRIIETIWGKRVRSMISGFVGVTSEIVDFERSFSNGRCQHFIAIGNGIDLNMSPLRNPNNEMQEAEIRMLFVGAGYRHHGLIRLIKSIDRYYRNGDNSLEIHLKIAGNSSHMVKYKRLVKKLNLLSKIQFLGNIENENLNELFNWAHVGVASLGLHKIGLSKSSTLKAKEYFIRGLPFFWSSSDDDFPDNYPYVLKLKSEDSPFDISEIFSFVERIKIDQSHPQIMRQYAAENFDWSIKMKKLITFFDEVYKDNYKPNKTPIN